MSAARPAVAGRNTERAAVGGVHGTTSILAVAGSVGERGVCLCASLAVLIARIAVWRATVGRSVRDVSGEK